MKWKTIKMEETRKQPSKSQVIGSFIGMGMVVSVLKLDSWGHTATPGLAGAHASC